MRSDELGHNTTGPGHPYEFKHRKGSRSPGMPDIGYSPTSRHSSHLPGHDLPAFAGTTGLESDYVRCLHCGYILNQITTSPGSGYGNIQTVPITLPDTTIAKGVQDPVVGGGCPFCGSSNFMPGLSEVSMENERTGIVSETLPGP